MTNFENRDWVEDSLRFWRNTTPNRAGVTRKLIAWNIGQLTAALERLDARSRA